MSHPLPSIADVKQQAKALRHALQNRGQVVSRSQSLELLAQQLGHRDWNTLHAEIGNRPALPFSVGQGVSGRYLGQNFTGTIIAMRQMADDRYFRLTLRFEAPVDVIPFERMSNLRQQVTVTVDRAGRTAEKTSDGQSHLVLQM